MSAHDVIRGEVYSYVFGVLGIDRDRFDPEDLTLAIENALRSEGYGFTSVVAGEPRNLSELRDRMMREGWDITGSSERAELWVRGGEEVIVPKAITPESYEWPGVLRRVGMGGVCPTCGAPR